jgi:hypothetical protein
MPTQIPVSLDERRKITADLTRLLDDCKQNVLMLLGGGETTSLEDHATRLRRVAQTINRVSNVAFNYANSATILLNRGGAEQMARREMKKGGR